MPHMQNDEGDKGMSVSLKIINGTPNHGEKPLCFRCRNAHITKGQQVSDIRIRCLTNYEQPIWIRKPVIECSEFEEKTGHKRSEMEKLAWILETKKGRPIGFFNPLEHKWRAKSGEADEDDD